MALGEKLQIDASSLALVLDDCQKAGWTERRPSPPDRRRHAIHLTPPGRRVLVRCAVTWGLVVAGFLGAQLTMRQVPPRPMGMAMGVAAGTFAYLAWVLWRQRSPQLRHAWVCAAVALRSRYARGVLPESADLWVLLPYRPIW